MAEYSTEHTFKNLLNDYSFIMVLIRAVKVRYTLWDSGTLEYWNMYIKEANVIEWITITEALKKRFGKLYWSGQVTAESVIKQKWETLRMDYYKLIRQTAPVSSTCEARRFFKELKFLIPAIMSSKQDIQMVLKYPAVVLNAPPTRHNARIFYQSVFSDDAFIELLIGEVEKRPILWDTRLAEHFDLTPWYALLESLDDSFESLILQIRDIAVISLVEMWYDLKDSYIAQIHETSPGWARINLEKFSEQLSFLKSLITYPNRQISHDKTKEQVSTSDVAACIGQGPSAMNITPDEINVSNIPQDCRSQITESSSKIREACGKSSASCTIPFLGYNSPAVSSYGHIHNSFHKDGSGVHVFPSMSFPSYELQQLQQVTNNLQQDCRSLTKESTQPSRIAAPYGTSSSSNFFPFCKYNSSYGNYPDTLHEDISIAQVRNSMSFSSYEPDSNSFQRENRLKIPEECSRIMTPNVQFPSSSVISSCAQNAPQVLDDRYVTNNFHPVTSCELDFLSSMTEQFGFIPYKNGPNEFFLRRDSNMQKAVPVYQHRIETVPQM